jgi:hypothetical protein
MNVGRKLMAVIAVVLALISGVLAWQQRHGRLALQAQVVSLADEVTNKNDALHEQAALLDRLQKENEVYSREFAALREKASTRVPPPKAHDRESNASTASSEERAAKMFSRMAKDPKLKEVTRQWQVARIKKVYGDFVRARHLNPPQTKQFFDLLVQDDARTRDESAKLLDREKSETDAGADEAKSATQKAEIERQLKLLLGDSDYAEYETYKQSTGARLTLLQIQEHFARTSIPLRDDQANTLLQIMLEERHLNQRIFDRMETVLTPEQYQELERFQEESREMEKVRIEAAREMMDIDRLREENDTYIKESALLRERGTTPAPEAQDAGSERPLSSSDKNKVEFAAKTLDDPRAREVIRQKQAAQLKQVFGDFVKENNLSAGQAEQFFRLLIDEDMQAMDEGTNFFSGSEDVADSSGTEAKPWEKRKAELDQQLKELLGEAGFAKYEAYRKTAGERQILIYIREQLGLHSTPLREDQTNTLLQILMEERARTPDRFFDPNGPQHPREKFRKVLEGDNVDQYYREEMAYNQRVRGRTGTILSPEQFEALENFQNQYLEVSKFGIEMAREIMAAKKK